MMHTMTLSEAQNTQYWLVGQLMKKMERMWTEWDVVYFKVPYFSIDNARVIYTKKV